MISTINLQVRSNFVQPVKFPISKKELLKEYGEVPLSYLWENDTVILLRDILQSAHTEIFNSELELELSLKKFLRRYKM